MAARDSARHAVDHLAADLRGIFGARLRSLGTYGRQDAGAANSSTTGEDGIHTVAFVDAVTMDDLGKCAQASAGWVRAGLAIPLVVPSNEFTRSLDAFPLEYGQIIATYVAVSGDNPFHGVGVRMEDLRRACEVQAKSHLLHLREGYIESGGRGAAVARLVAYSVAAFRALLTNVARLQGARAESLEELADYAGTIGLSRPVVSEVLASRKAGGLAAADGERLFPPYLDAVERIARLVDRWHA